MPEHWIISPLALRSLLGWLQLGLYAVVLLFWFWRARPSLTGLGRARWGRLLLLAVAGFGLGAFFPLFFPFDSAVGHALAIDAPRVQLLLFAAVPLLIAAAWINAPAAALVGLATGLGRLLLSGDMLLAPFYLAVGGALAGWLLHQPYRGRLFFLLRQPLVAGVLSQVALAPLTALAAFTLTPPSISVLAALDTALGIFYLSGGVLLLEGLVGGAFIWLLAISVPGLRLLPAVPQAHPWTRTVRGRIVFVYAMLVGVTLLTTLLVVPALSVRVARQLVTNQMAQDSRAVVEALPGFRAERENILVQLSGQPALAADDAPAQAATLQQAFRAGAFFHSLVLTDLDGNVQAQYPPTLVAAPSTGEKARLREATETGWTGMMSAQTLVDDEYVISFVLPVAGDGDRPVRALIGRVPTISLNQLILSLDGLLGSGTGFIVDDQARIIAHPNPDMVRVPWEPPNGGGPATAAGKLVDNQDGVTNTRELSYYVREGEGSGWTVVTEVPFDVVLGLAVDIAFPLLSLLSVLFIVAGPFVVVLGRHVTAPLGSLVGASQRMAEGHLDRVVDLDREDEFGELGRSFETMRRNLRKQVSEMELLIEASRNVRTGVDVRNTLPPILRNALRGTGAAAIRAVLVGSGSRPIAMAEGPAAAAVAQLDRYILRMAQHAPEDLLLLRDEAALREHLPARLTDGLPIRAIVILPLRYGSRYNGALWLGYRQPHQLSPIERTLLELLAGHAAAIAENTRLFITAEGGRRRLAAVLSNIVDGVIVTGPKRRIVILNPAMERAFGLNKGHINQPLQRLGLPPALVDALTQGTERSRPVEITAPNGRIFSAYISDILGIDRSALGRVAVLRDITRIRDEEKLRIEFLNNVSHSLNSPLTAVRGNTSILLEEADSLTEDQHQRLTNIHDANLRMAQLLEDLLSLERIRSGRLRMQTVAIGALLTEVEQQMRGPVHEAGLELILEIADDIPLISADRGLLREAVINLISNANKYAPRSGDATLFAGWDGQYVTIGLRDQGPGIEPDQLRRIFESNYRRPETMRSNVPGTGLGLALVRATAQRHGGDAWCDSTLGQGSTFYITVAPAPPVDSDEMRRS